MPNVVPPRERTYTPLKKQRWELFAIGIAKGLTPAKSYAEAGWTGKGGAGSAARLVQNPQIAARIAELREEMRLRAAGLPDITQLEIAIAERDGQVKEKWERYKALRKIRDERAAWYTDPMNPVIRNMTMPKADLLNPEKKPDLRKVPGIETGYVIVDMKLVGKTVVPYLKQDTPMMREMSNLEAEIAQLMGFLKPINLNVDIDARQDNRQVNVTNEPKIIRVISVPEDNEGQW